MLNVQRYSTDGQPLEAALGVMLQKWRNDKQVEVKLDTVENVNRWVQTLDFAKYLVEHFDEFKQFQAVLENLQKPNA